MRTISSPPISSPGAGGPRAPRLKNWLGLFLALAVLPAVNAHARQRELRHERPPEERRIALVIGNSAYAVGPLKNPVNDARAMTQALREVGFEVIHREDLKREDMRRAIRELGVKIGRGGVGLFYYAGHGVQVKGENYLIPVDAAPESADEVDDDGVNATYVLEKMESAGNGMNIVVLDACRNNPFTRSFRSGSDGLASVNAPAGTLIAYATAPGAVASDGGDSGNGVYTQELLKILKTPGLSIEEVFKRVRIAVRQRTQGRQTPWESSSLVGDFYFSERRRPGASPAPRAEVVDVERYDWEKIKDSVDPKDFEAFLKRYPRGKFSRQATDALAPLLATKEPAGPEVSQPAGSMSPAAGEVADGMPFMVFHNHLLGMVGGRLLVSPSGLEYKEAKGGKQEDAFSVPCGGFVMSRDNGNLWRGSSSFNIKLPAGKEINIGLWGGEEEEMLRQAIAAFCERRLPDYLKTDEGGRPSTSPRGISRFDGFQVNVAYRHPARLAEAVRIANRLNSLGAFAGVSKLHIPEGDKLATMTGVPGGFYVTNFDAAGAEAILFYHDDLEGVARKMAQELDDRVEVVTRKTGQGKRHEFHLWLL